MHCFNVHPLLHPNPVAESGNRRVFETSRRLAEVQVVDKGTRTASCPEYRSRQERCGPRTPRSPNGVPVGGGSPPSGPYRAEPNLVNPMNVE